MLMIGVQGQCPDEGKTGKYGPWAGGFVQPSITEQRTHFGLWCALSSPLTLSIDFTNKSAVDSVWPIITNKYVRHQYQHARAQALVRVWPLL